MIEVIEFISELKEGYTEAFLCRGEDGLPYVAKSRRSGKESLVREWVCGRIGREFGLPIPPFEMLYVAQSVASYAANEHIEPLAAAPGFGSQQVGTKTNEVLVGLPVLNVADVPEIDETL